MYHNSSYIQRISAIQWQTHKRSGFYCRETFRKFPTWAKQEQKTAEFQFRLSCTQPWGKFSCKPMVQMETSSKGCLRGSQSNRC